MSRIENDITKRLLAGDLTFEQGQRAMKDPEAFKLSLKMAKGVGEMRYRFWGRVRTQRLYVAYCWSTKRNEAGYFLGWREHYNEKAEMVSRDQWTGRKNKTRLREMQLRRTLNLIEAGGRVSKRTKEATSFWAAKLREKTEAKMVDDI